MANLTDAERDLKRTAQQIFDGQSLDIDRVEELHTGNVLIEVSSTDGSDVINRNIFGGMRLRDFLNEGYVAHSVAGGEDYHIAWFRPTNIHMTFK